MECSTSKVEGMKPVLLRAGIPVGITVMGFVLAKIAGRKYFVSKAPSLSETTENSAQNDSQEIDRDDEQSFHSLDSASLPCLESDHGASTDAYSNAIEILHMQEEISGLRRQIQDQDTRFLCYKVLKEQELVLMEHENILQLETTRVEFLSREISSMVAEIQRFENMVMEYLKIMELLENLRSDNVLLLKRVKKLSRRNKEQYLVLRKQNNQILAQEAEISRTRKEVEMKENCIKDMSDQIRELKIAEKGLQGDKFVILSNLAEKSNSSKFEGEAMSLEDFTQVRNEAEHLQRDREAETKELIYLRWCNACLRHQLMRRKAEEDELIVEENNHLEMNSSGEITELGSDHELPSSFGLGNGKSCLGFTAGGDPQSKRRKLISKLKRWVEGSEKMKKKMHEKKLESKCVCRHSVSEDPEDMHPFPARKSCSSV